MRKTLWLVFAFLFVGFLSVDATAGTVSSKFDVSLGGYIKLDYIHQDAALGPLGAPVKADGLAASETVQSILTARQSRIHLKVTGPEVLGAKSIAFVEGDFYGPGGSNSSGNFRMRHANGTLVWKDTQFMFGQFWDIFAPGAASTLDFDTGGFIGCPSNPRVAQARLTHNIRFNESNWLMVLGGVEDPIQNANGFETSGVNVAGQVMFNSKSLGVSPGYWGIPMQPLIAGFFGIWGQEKIKTNSSGNQDKDIYGYGFYTHVPVLKSSDGKSRAMTLSLEAQTFMSAGMNAGGMHANAVPTITKNNGDLAPAKGYGAWGQLMFYPTDPMGIVVGYGRRNVINSKDYPAGAEQYNSGLYTNVSYDFSGAVRLAAEYERIETKYLGGVPAGAKDDKGIANRFQVSALYFF